MSIIPLTSSGGIPVQDGAGNATNPVGVQCAYVPGAGFSFTCNQNALPSDCTARITPAQINGFMSELIGMAEAFTPNGEWDCASLTNIADSFNAWVNGTGASTLGQDAATGICADPAAIAILVGCLASIDTDTFGTITMPTPGVFEWTSADGATTQTWNADSYGEFEENSAGNYTWTSADGATTFDVNLVSADTGNLITNGSDGGSFLNLAALNALASTYTLNPDGSITLSSLNGTATVPAHTPSSVVNNGDGTLTHNNGAGTSVTWTDGGGATSGVASVVDGGSNLVNNADTANPVIRPLLDKDGNSINAQTSYLIPGPAADQTYIEPIADVAYQAAPGEGVPVVCDPVSKKLKGAPEHDVKVTNFNLSGGAFFSRAETTFPTNTTAVVVGDLMPRQVIATLTNDTDRDMVVDSSFQSQISYVHRAESDVPDTTRYTVQTDELIYLNGVQVGMSQWAIRDQSVIVEGRNENHIRGGSNTITIAPGATATLEVWARLATVASDGAAQIWPCYSVSYQIYYGRLLGWTARK